MEFPVRCFSCGKVLSQMADSYKKHVIDGGENADEYLDKLRLRRECCRCRFLTFPWQLREDFLLYDVAAKSGGAKLS